MEENTTTIHLKMNYKWRTILLILVWIVLVVVVGAATVFYGYYRSVEVADQTIRESLLKVDESIGDLIHSEAEIRGAYEQAHGNMGQMVPLLQEHGLEDTVPSKNHMRKYAKLLGANYIAVLDPDGKTAVSYGKFIKTKQGAEVYSDSEIEAYLTSAMSLVPADQDMSVFEEEIQDGYSLVYQISNERANTVQNDAFSWRAILRDLKLSSEASLVVISQQDDTILVHHDKEMIGKSYEAMGFASKEAFLNAYRKPDTEGIAYQKNLSNAFADSQSLNALVASGINLLGKGSGYIDTEGLYVICNMPGNMTLFYLLQQRIVLIIYVLLSLLVLCYILLHFRWCRRKEKETQAANTVKAGGSRIIGYRFGFYYDRAWSRRLLFCCIIMLALCLVLSVHAELLSSSAQTKIQKAQSEKLAHSIAKLNKEHRAELNDWYNETNIQTADIIAYVLTRDDTLQTRDTMKEISERFDVPQVYLFDQDGKMIVTNSNFDHIDLRKKLIPRMSSTFLPLLFGLDANASTAVMKNDADTGEDKKADAAAAERTEEVGNLSESTVAYAGVSIRNERDLCDGALGIATEPLSELWNGGGIQDETDAFSVVMDLTQTDSRTAVDTFTSSQLTLVSFTLLRLALCLALFYCLAVLQRKPGKGKKKRKKASAGGAMAEAPALHELEMIEEAFAEGAAAARSTIENTAAKVAEEAGVSPAAARDKEELFQSLFGRERDRSFSERWNHDSTPLRKRSPEKQLFFIIRCILVVLCLGVVLLYLTRGEFLSVNSPLRDVVSGGWEKGVNLYAITATEMIILVAVVLWMALHRLVYFIARYSTPRGETVCHLVYSMITYAAVLVAIYYSLSTFGVETKTILAGAGILGIVISFGAQGTIADILSGMFLIFEDVIHVGDFVKVGMNTGIVKSVGVRMTKIQSFGTVISINNAELKATQNISDGVAYIRCSLLIDGKEDEEKVRQIVEQELPDINDRIKATGYTATNVSYGGVSSHDENGMKLKFGVFGSAYGSGRVKKMLYEELAGMCEKNGISLAASPSQLEHADDSVEAGELPAKPAEPAGQPLRAPKAEKEPGALEEEKKPGAPDTEKEPGIPEKAPAAGASVKRGPIDKIVDKLSR